MGFLVCFFGWGFFWCLVWFFIALKLTDFQMKKQVFGSFDSQSFVTELYTEPWAAETTAFQLLRSLQSKKLGTWNLFLNLLTPKCNCKIPHPHNRRQSFWMHSELTFISYKCCYFIHTINCGDKAKFKLLSYCTAKSQKGSIRVYFRALRLMFL